jgi:hypothetical protein
MRRTTTTEVFIETEKIIFLRAGGHVQKESARCGWCATCGAESFLFTPEAAAVAASTTPRAIYQLVEASRLHFTETTTGQLFICLASLSQLASAPTDEDAPTQ